MESGKATPQSRLHPFPDPDARWDTTLDQMEPTVFAPGEDEAGWETPEGKLVENNPIFDEVDKEEAKVAGWKEVRAVIAKAKVSKVSAGEKSRKKPVRKFGQHDWPDRSYLNLYYKARVEYEGMVQQATRAFAEAEEEDRAYALRSLTG